ncbi:MAG: alanyl-tRNA editing protein, partial [Oscillospiraceae bacterium]|nr:alanyl-tRNA editing protein [Oscillospiraceae bacterium]
MCCDIQSNYITTVQRNTVSKHTCLTDGNASSTIKLTKFLRQVVMTEKLYYTDGQIKDFTAKVVSCSQNEKGAFEIVLDRTAFFTGGGGQKCDLGMIGGAEVTEVREQEGGGILHTCTAGFEPGTSVDCSIDWDTRFHRMQNHSGEHIVSGFVHRLFGYENVGFHMGSEDITIDFSGPLTREDLEKIETLANQAVWENREVRILFPSSEELENYDYRSKLELTEDVRLVEIDGVDLCACCAPHVGKTGEIGAIKILDAINYKGGTRVHLLCGYDAMMDYRARHNMERETAASLSVKQNELGTAVSKLSSELENKKHELARANLRISELLAGQYAPAANICAFADLDQNALRNLVNINADKAELLSAGFAGNDKDGYRYIIASRSLDL